MGKGEKNKPRCFKGDGFDYVPAKTWGMGNDRTPYPSPQDPTALHGGPTKNKLKAVGLVI